MGFDEQVPQFVLPVTPVRLRLVEHLKPENVVLERLPELLPGHPLAGAGKVAGYRAFVPGIQVPLQMRPLAFEHHSYPSSSRAFLTSLAISPEVWCRQ